MISGPPGFRDAELLLRDELSHVRFVFELGFPEELVILAEDTVRESAGQRVHVLSDRACYPASECPGRALAFVAEPCRQQPENITAGTMPGAVHIDPDPGWWHDGE